MDISCVVTSNPLIKSWELPNVRPDVPNPGMVTPMMFSLGSLSFSNAAQVTNNANVESNPPEIPRTAFLIPVFAKRWASPAA